MTRRHPAQVTADRLLEAVRQWPHRFTSGEAAAMRSIAERLEQVAEHDDTTTEDGWRCSCGAQVSLPGHPRGDLDELFIHHAAPIAGDESDPEEN